MKDTFLEQFSVLINQFWDLVPVHTMTDFGQIHYLKISLNNVHIPQLFKSFEFGNGCRMSDENLVILEFNYLQNKKWYKQAVKNTRIKNSYRTYCIFSFNSDNW